MMAHKGVDELDASMFNPENTKKSKFSWADGKVLTFDDFNIEDKIAYIEGFIFSSAVTLIYSPAKQGKTFLAYGIAGSLAEHEAIEEVHYLDMDNSIFTLKERGVDTSLLQMQNIHYHTRSTIGMEPLDALKNIAHGGVASAYKGIAFFLDTTKDFVDTDNKSQAVQFMKYCTMIRDAGGTVVVLHHATKNNRKISGNQAFTNTPDNVYEMKQSGKRDNIINYELKVTHARGLVKDCRWSVDTKTLKLMEYDAVSSGMSDTEKQNVDAGVSVLKNSKEGLSQSKLIEAMGYSRTNRTGKRLVKELIGTYWRVEEKSINNHIYHFMGEKHDKQTKSL